MQPNDEKNDSEKPGDTLESRKNGNPLGRTARNAGASAIGIGVLLAKYFLVFGKALALSWTFLLSLWLYVIVFGWRFAIVLILLLLAHELGHYAAFRAYGLPVRLPQFVPFLGAYTMGTPPQDLEHDAYIALAGPLTGLGLSVVCYAIGDNLHDAFWLAIANVSAFLNLFNMIPTPPFDGGRIIGAVTPLLWILGCALFVGLSLYLGLPIIFVLLIALLGLPAIIAAWRGHVDPRAAAMTPAARLRVSLSYLGTLAGLIWILAVSHVNVQPGQTSIL